MSMGSDRLSARCALCDLGIEVAADAVGEFFIEDFNARHAHGTTDLSIGGRDE